MPIVAEILDERNDGGPLCFLSKISLENYVDSLPANYRNYDVQREIVTNVYLDRLVDTVLNKRHIPPIVLVIDEGAFRRDERRLEIDKFKILDGLQRTFRLDVVKRTIRFCLDNVDNPTELLDLNRFAFSRRFSGDLRQFDSTTNTFRAVVQFMASEGREALISSFSENSQWFEIWANLTPRQEVQKMLTLNAGHKAVKTRHQLELLFLNLLDQLQLEAGEEFTIRREKDISSTQFSKTREVGAFHFAHIISALLSLGLARPVTPSTTLIQNIQSDDRDEENLDFVTPELLAEVMRFLVRLDRLVVDNFPEHGRIWFGREVTLAGIFGAIGFAANEMQEDPLDVMVRLQGLLEAQPALLALPLFEDTRNSLDLSKINIGTANRSAIFSAFKHLLSSDEVHPIDWEEMFGVTES